MKTSWTNLEPRSIARAIELWHELGSEEFIARTRFKDSHRYVVMDRGQPIASKPLVAMAFQLQFSCGKDGPPRLSGGDQTRAILDRLGDELVDIQGENLKDTAESLRIAVGRSTKFWWANQSVNFTPVYDDGTLWAPLKDRRGQQVDHWRTLDGVVPGDLVMHYASPEIRGLSRVATMPQPAYPPRGYDDVPADTKGTLVLTEPVHEIRVSRDRALGVLDNGQGPVTAGGILRNGYFFPWILTARWSCCGGQAWRPSGKQRMRAECIPNRSGGMLAARATDWRSWRSGPSSVSCGTSSCAAGAIRVRFAGAPSRKNYSWRRISSPARPVRKTSEWIHETCPCSLVCSAAMRSLSSAMLSSVSMESSNVAAAVPSRLRNGYVTSSV